MSNFSRILVPVDFSDNSMDALRQACDLGRRFDAEIHVVHVLEPWAPAAAVDQFVPDRDKELVAREKARINEALEALPPAEWGPQPVKRELVVGMAAPEVVKYAEQQGIELIVLGTHGRTGLARWFMGSVAEKVVRFAPCAVLVVRPAEAPTAA
ncbi:MAG: universal stress protein [Planctomyces sp.]|nr:universal stress protein [Planctomyces sp.]